MKVLTRFVCVCGLLMAVAPVATYAHFKLLEPASWITESAERGDPQKAAPCGTDAKTPGTPTAAITKYVGGSKFHLKVQETIFHSGHFRVALAVNSRTELPPDPTTVEKITDKGVYSVWAAIQSPPQLPVLADGLFPHYVRPTDGKLATYETDIELPNINCKKCTLQVIQFMANHVYNMPGGYSYHHCADIAITADPMKPITQGWPLEATQAASR